MGRTNIICFGGFASFALFFIYLCLYRSLSPRFLHPRVWQATSTSEARTAHDESLTTVSLRSNVSQRPELLLQVKHTAKGNVFLPLHEPNEIHRAPQDVTANQVGVQQLRKSNQAEIPTSIAATKNVIPFQYWESVKVNKSSMPVFAKNSMPNQLKSSMALYKTGKQSNELQSYSTLSNMKTQTSLQDFKAKWFDVKPTIVSDKAGTVKEKRTNAWPSLLENTLSDLVADVQEEQTRAVHQQNSSTHANRFYSVKNDSFAYASNGRTTTQDSLEPNRVPSPAMSSVDVKKADSATGLKSVSGILRKNSVRQFATAQLPVPGNSARLSTDVASGKSSKKTILMWSHPWDAEPETPPEGSAIGNCTITYNRGLLPKADAVVFPYMSAPVSWKHYRFSTRDVTGQLSVTSRHSRQRFVWFSEESPWVVRWYSGRHLKEYDNGFFNWTMTYRRDADIYNPYSSMHDLYEILPKGKQVVKKILAKKTGIAVWLVSECSSKRGALLRMKYVDEMMRFIPNIKRYGKCFKNGHQLAGNKIRSFLESHKFYLAFENSLHCKDYITEKFFDNALLHNAVPVVWGTMKSDYLRIAPPHSFIHAEDFSSPEELAKYLLYLNSNDTAYREYFKWREDPGSSWDDLRRQVEQKYPSIKTSSHRTFGYEQLCHKLFTAEGQKIIPSLREEIFKTESNDCTEIEGENDPLQANPLLKTNIFVKVQEIRNFLQYLQEN